MRLRCIEDKDLILNLVLGNEYSSKRVRARMRVVSKTVRDQLILDGQTSPIYASHIEDIVKSIKAFDTIEIVLLIDDKQLTVSKDDKGKIRVSFDNHRIILTHYSSILKKRIYDVIERGSCNGLMLELALNSFAASE